MGRQESLVQFSGNMGNVSFYKSKVDGFMSRKKGGVTGDRIKFDPAYERTRENMAEFARAGQAAKLLRTAFRSLVLSMADKRVTGRLTAAMMKVIIEDGINNRGERTIINAESERLQGFEFNRNARLTETIHTPFTGSIDRETGTMVVDIPAFTPKVGIVVPEGASHFRFQAAGAAIDFTQGIYSLGTAASANLPIGKQEQAPIQVSLSVEPASESPLFLLFGIEFLQVIKNGSESPLNSGAHNAMTILKVDGGV